MAEVRARVDFKVGPKSDIEAELLSFNGLASDKEHVAIIFKRADKINEPPLVRMHSECLTGDVFHSSRCDCGEQLEETIRVMGEKGGVLLYLRQEGRGIGLEAKIKAYALQDVGYDTLDANLALNLPADARDYSFCADMLRNVGVTQVKLMTNNPLKIRGLRSNGIRVEERMPHLAGRCEYNDHYLSTKQKRMGHLIPEQA